MDSVTIEEDGPLLLIGVNRPEAHNLWNLEVIQAVSRACRRLADSDHLRVGVIFGHGRLFTAGLDLASVAPLVATGDPSAIFPADGLDPWDFFGEPYRHVANVSNPTGFARGFVGRPAGLS
jgi:enoyl-CoA hydratase/carnithine racemase